MPRLNKISRELNISLETLCEFLSSKGFEVEVNPNTKITDVQAEIAIEHFANSTSSNPRVIAPLEDFDWSAFEAAAQRVEEEENTSSIFNQHDIVSAVIISINRREVVVNLGYKTDAVIPASELRYNPDIKVGDTVDVYIESMENARGQIVASHRKARLSKSWDKINAVFENNETIKVYVKCRTKGGMIVDAFGMEAFLPGSQMDIVKVFDLDSYIGKTLDVKVIKINEEYKNVVVSHREVVSENLQKRTADKSLLKDIWQKHTEVQEQILRHRTEPISIIPSLSSIVNEKLHVRIDTSDNTNYLKSRIMESLDISDEDCHFEEGFVYAPYNNWSKLDEREKSRISTQANKEYVSFSYYPVIDGKITDSKAQFTGVKELLDRMEIEYDFDKKRRLQISINELQRLKESEEFQSLQVSLPDETSAIIQTYPSILYYLERLFPNHNFKNVEVFKDTRHSLGGVAINKQFVVEGGYLKEDTLKQLEDLFEPRMCRIEFDFHINEDATGKYDWKVNRMGLPVTKDGSILFWKQVKQSISDIFEEEYTDNEDDNQNEHFLSDENDFFNRKDTTDIQFEYTLDCQIINRIFGAIAFN